MDYRQLAYQTAQKYGIDPDLFVLQIQAESAFRPDAVSSAGAIGLGQLMPATAKELGVDPTDPVQNLEGAARYMKQQLDRFGDPALALAAYNAGPSRVAKANGVPNITETQNYVAKILGGKGGAAMAQEPQKPQGLLGGLLGGQGIGGALGMSDDFRDKLKMAILAGTGDARMDPLIRATAARMEERRGEAKEQRQRNKSLEYLKQRADAGDVLAKQYYEAASTGVLPVGAGIAGYLEQMTKVPKVSEAEKQINRLMETGVDRPTAIAIRDGRLKISRNPVTQRAELIDMATGGIVGQATEALAQEVGAEEAAPADDRFKGLPVGQAGGLVGWGAGIVNTVTDALGAGQQFPNIGEAQAAMKDLSTRTVLMLDADFAGKPTNFTREKVEELTVKPSEITQGSAQSYQKTVNMISALEEAMAGAKAAINNPSQYSPQKVREAESSVSKLQDLLDDYTSLKNAFESKGLASQGAVNGQPTVVQTDQDRALIQKYSNPNYIRDNMLPSPN
jgi:hypothetical protein